MCQEQHKKGGSIRCITPNHCIKCSIHGIFKLDLGDIGLSTDLGIAGSRSVGSGSGSDRVSKKGPIRDRRSQSSMASSGVLSEAKIFSDPQDHFDSDDNCLIEKDGKPCGTHVGNRSAKTKHLKVKHGMQRVVRFRHLL